jgi:hyperosmotically inducible protein
MRNDSRKRLAARLAIGLALSFSNLFGQQPNPPKPVNSAPKVEESLLSREIRHQLLVVPYYSVFDYLSFTLDGGKVTLTGQVLRPSLRSEAEAAVKSIEGVTSVSNLIEILPKSSSDDDARRAVYRAVFEDSMLQRYAIPDVPSIHIIVKDGSVTLEGIVGTELEKNLATTRASSVAGISKVKNNLAIHSKDASAN